MDGAVKMPGAQVKVNTAGRVQAAQASSDTGVDFIKLLQAKSGQPKAEAQDKTQPKAQDTAKPSSKDVKDPQKDAADKKTENLTDEVNTQDDTAEEMAQQAAVQQAAALLSGMFTESQEVTAETIVPETENLIQTGEILTEALPTPEAAVTDPTAADLTPVQPLPETPAEVTPEAVLPNPVQETPEQPEKALQTELPQQKTAEAAEKAPKPAETRPEEPKAQDPVQNVSGAQKPEETSEAGKQSAQEDLTGKENQKSEAPAAPEGETTQTQAAGAETFRVFGHQEQNTFFGQKTETVSMKTAPETLPEDLGKTLGAKFADGAKTLTVELEPASLGKLTIRLTYEGDRAAVSIMATNPKTLELLNQKASEIAAILEEKTGQQTIIYTQKPETNQENYDRNPDGRSNQEDREEKQNHQQKEEHQQFDSFAQQLRLGLI